MLRHVVVMALVVGLMAADGVSAAPVGGDRAQETEDHGAHHRMLAQGGRRYARSVVAYRVPDVTLLDANGGKVALQPLLTSPGPVALNFIFTTCTTVCPVMTATFAQMRRELGTDGDGLRRVSISIDPEYDTPGVLKAYAEKFGAAADWRFLTGGAAQIAQVQRAFGAYTGSKVNHRPVTFFRAAGTDSWVRIDGLASGAELASEYRQLLGK